MNKYKDLCFHTAANRTIVELKSCTYCLAEKYEVTSCEEKYTAVLVVSLEGKTDPVLVVSLEGKIATVSVASLQKKNATASVVSLEGKIPLHQCQWEEKKMMCISRRNKCCCVGVSGKKNASALVVSLRGRELDGWGALWGALV